MPRRAAARYAMGMHTRGFALAAALAAHAPAAHAAPLVREGLVAFLDFEDGAGAVAADRTGSGHDGELAGAASWEAGALRLDGEGARVCLEAPAALRAGSFTWDLWLEVADRTRGDGRALSQAGRVGGNGPELLERSGR